MNKFMKLAFERAKATMNKNFGGPFGAAIVKNDQILSISSNSVLHDKDPTAHAEINAIREACKKLNSYNLTGCTLYTTCFPCPMCIGAIIWANIKDIHVACLPKDAANIGFRDDFIYDFIKGNFDNQELLKINYLDRNDCLRLFEEYKKNNKTIY